MKQILLPILGAALLIVTAGARQAPQVAPASQQPSDVSTTISSDAAGTPPRFAVPDFIALVEGRGNRQGGAHDRRGALERPELRTRVRSHAEGRLRDDSGGDVDVRRAAGSLARGQRRRRDHRHGAEGRHRRAHRGAALQRPQPDLGLRPGVPRLDRQPADLRAQDVRRNPPAAARAARRGPDQADLQLRPRRRAGDRHHREAEHEGDLHRRLRRREPAPGDDRASR